MTSLLRIPTLPVVSLGLSIVGGIMFAIFGLSYFVLVALDPTWLNLFRLLTIGAGILMAAFQWVHSGLTFYRGQPTNRLIKRLNDIYGCALVGFGLIVVLLVDWPEDTTRVWLYVFGGTFLLASAVASCFIERS